MAEWTGGSELLAKGSQGQSVKELQKKLTGLGYDVGGVDGILGQRTEAALKDFQKDAGISVDGIAGSQTYAALQNAPSKPKQTTQTSNAPTNQPAPTYQQPAGSAGGGGATGSTPGQQQQPAYQPMPQKVSGLDGYMALSGADLQGQLQEFSQIGKGAMAPYEEMIRGFLTSQPTYSQRTDDELLDLARQRTQLVYDPQRLALEQQIAELQRQAGASRQRVEADYAGAEESTQRMLEEARRQATESAIARGGGRSGQVDYFTGKMQQPIMTGFQQQQAQRAASLADIEGALTSGQTQASQRLDQLAEQEGLFTQQQMSAMQDTDYSRSQQEWQQGLQAAMGLAGLAGNQNQFNMNYAQSLLPYLFLTEAQRQGLPLDWASLMGQVPGSTP